MDVFTESYIRSTYSCKTKVALLNSILNVYCSSTYINRNLWMLQKIQDTLQDFENASRKPTESVTLLCKLVEYMKKLPQRKINISTENVQYMLYSTINIDNTLSFIKDIVPDETLSFYNVLFCNIKQNKEVSQSLAIANHIIINTTPRSRELDNYDCMFVFLLNLCDIVGVKSKIKRYVNCCKDIFYYRLKKREKEHRINLIFFAIYVLTSKKITMEPVNNTSHDYLFVAPKFNHEQQAEMYKIKSESSQYEKTKSINIQSSNSSSDIKINLVK